MLSDHKGIKMTSEMVENLVELKERGSCQLVLFILQYLGMEEDELEQSLDAESQFVPIPMGVSLVATSEKVYFQNASTINRQELETALKDKRQQSRLKNLPAEEQSQNQFLEVGKWKKAKDSTMNKDMQTVKEEVNQIITQTRWRKKDPPKKVQQAVADQTWVPGKTQEEEEEIEDQTQEEGEEKKSSKEGSKDEEEEDEEEQEQDEEQQEEESEEEEEEQEQEEEEEEEEEQEEEQEEEEEAEEEEEQERGEKEGVEGSIQYHGSENEREGVKVVKSNKSRVSSSQASFDDRTDAQSQMKRTDYEPGKWSKKEVQAKQDPWKRKELILLRIAKLVQ